MQSNRNYDGRQPHKGIGEQYTINNGRAALAIYSQPNSGQETANLSGNTSTERRAEQSTRSFFAISALHESVIYYIRCNFSSRSEGTIHCFDLKYPASEKRDWDDIVTRISRSLEPLERG